MTKHPLKKLSIVWLLSLALISFASIQSLHELVDHGEFEECQICLLSSSADSGVIPNIVKIPAIIADSAPELFIALIAPSIYTVPATARAPPVIATAE